MICPHFWRKIRTMVLQNEMAQIILNSFIRKKNSIDADGGMLNMILCFTKFVGNAVFSRVFNTQRIFQKFLNFLLNSRNRFLTSFSKNLRNVFKSSNVCPYVSIVKICTIFLEIREKTHSIHFLLVTRKQKIQHFGQYMCMIKHPSYWIFVLKEDRRGKKEGGGVLEALTCTFRNI